MDGQCNETIFDKCNLQKWRAKLKELSNELPELQLNTVNSYLNQFSYVDDRRNWGRDYWEIPQEFLKKFGDCEDYAIIKYLSLRELGWSADIMRIVVLTDMNLKVGHAVLIVNFQGKNMLLDNQITLVIDANKVHHYRPIYSLNEKGWWRHVPKRFAAP